MHFFSKVFSAQTTSSYALNTACFDVHITPMDKANYHSTVDVAKLGPLTLGLVRNCSSVVERNHETSSNPESKRYTITYVIDGEISISNANGTYLLKKGEFVLIDNSLQRKMFVYDSVHILLVCVTQKVLEEYIHVPENAVNQIMNEEGLVNGQSIFTPLLTIWEHLKIGELEDFHTTIGDELLHDIGVAYSKLGSLQNKSRHCLRLVHQIKGYIEANIADTELSVESIAGEFKISSRYLRTLFKNNEKVSHYIQRRRIEESAKLLTSPLFQANSITEIAYLCGFNSSTHFSRCFKTKYHETAREYRQRHLQMERMKL